MSTTICAIIPTYNRANMLRECIDSILAQTRPPDSIIVVNDGSTDNTDETVNSYGNRIKLLTKKNGGKSSALNLALAQCKADYVWICDDDDIAAPNGLQELARILDDNLNIDFVLGSYRMFYGKFSEKIFVDPPMKVRPSETDIKILFLEDMFTCQFAMLVRRKLYQSVGQFREDMIRSQDYEMSIRLSRAGKGERVPSVIFFQRQHAGIRGSAGDSFQAGNISHKWLIYDQKIFTALRETVPLIDYTPGFAKSWQKNRATRAALIERGSVFARRGLWDEASEDFKGAAGLTQEPITPEEVEILEVLVGFELAWHMLKGHKYHINSLRYVYKLNRSGRQIVTAACRPLVWYANSAIRTGHCKMGFALMRLMYQILGFRGMICRLSQSFIG